MVRDVAWEFAEGYVQLSCYYKYHASGCQQKPEGYESLSKLVHALYTVLS